MCLRGISFREAYSQIFLGVVYNVDPDPYPYPYSDSDSDTDAYADSQPRSNTGRVRSGYLVTLN